MQIKSLIKKLTPSFLLRLYHYGLAFLGAVVYGFPGKKMIVIGVTGTSGKSTTVDFITRILEESGKKVASMSSVRFKIGDKESKNTLKMTMPGRMKIQKFLKQALQQKCTHVVLEVTSEGIRQFRHKFIRFDTAVFTNLTPEHIESHGGFEKYRKEKLKLFKATKNNHVVNVDDENATFFLEISSQKKIGFFIDGNWQLPENLVHYSFLSADDVVTNTQGLTFKVEDVEFALPMLGRFNVYNALAAISVAHHYGVGLETCKKALEKVKGIPGRMEVVIDKPFTVIVDYAHTPEQLEKVCQTFSEKDSKLICVLGSCGGGRDKWKRPVLGKIAGQYCSEVIVTNEDPYDEDPMAIINEVAEGAGPQVKKIVDRGEAIKSALLLAQPGDSVIITGKGSEMWMCLENGKKIPWDDREVVRKTLQY